jgi:hypothetical protein
MDRFEAKYIPEPNSGCWIWTGAVGSHGYGMFGLGGGKTDTAPRFSYRRHKGEIPAGMYVMHSCDNRLCVNPDHLDAGTPRQNSLDCYKRDRRKPVSLPGERHGMAKLTAATVAAIRADPCSERRAAVVYGISPSQVHRIRRMQSWKGGL